MWYIVNKINRYINTNKLNNSTSEISKHDRAVNGFAAVNKRLERLETDMHYRGLLENSLLTYERDKSRRKAYELLAAGENGMTEYQRSIDIDMYLRH